MLPTNIDLTEHRDFGNGHINFLGRLSIDLDAEEMSLDQYKEIVWWEGIFGKTRHSNQKREVFEYEKKYYERWKDTCEKCGKPLRCPWKRAGSLCIECDEDMEYSRLPWVEKYGQIATNINRTMDIFSMR